MNNQVHFLAESSLALLLFYLIYALLLSHQTCFAFNRFYLLISLLFAFLIPFLELPYSPAVTALQANTNTIQVQPETVGILNRLSIVSATSVKAETFHYWFWLYVIYMSGLFIAGILFCRHFLKLYDFIYSHTGEGYYWQQIKVIPTNGELATFSFLHYILFDNSQLFTPAEKELILRHEQAHVVQKHTFDILFIKLLTIIFWFNPLLYFYKKALKSTHEYLADAKVLQEEDTEVYAAFLIRQVFYAKGFFFGNFFHIHKSLTLRRLAMMKNLNHKPNVLRQLLVVALLAALAIPLASNTPVSFSSLEPKNSNLKSIPRVVVPDWADQESINQNEASFQASQFPGGAERMYNFFNKNIKYPTDGLELNDSFTWVMITVKIDQNGKPEINNTDIKDVFIKEAFRVTNLFPKFEPAKKNGDPIVSNYTFSIYFRHNSDTTKIDNKKNQAAFKIVNGVPNSISKPIIVTTFVK